MSVRIIQGDCRDVLRTLPDQSVHCIVCSPPYYGLRSYLPEGHEDKAKELGLEQTPDDYVAEMVAVFREARRVLRDDGTLFLNLGDSYAGGRGGRDWHPNWGDGHRGSAGDLGRMAPKKLAGAKPKDLLMIPARVALALQADGWYLRQDIIWHKPNPMPESCTDRCTKAHEYVFLLSKSAQYWYGADAIAEPSATFGRQNTRGMSPKLRAKQDLGHLSKKTGMDNPYKYETRNLRSVWTIATEPSPIAHYAMMPTALAELCIKAGCPLGGTVLDCFAGAGTTGLVADRLGRSAVLIELSTDHAATARNRLAQDAGMFAMVAAE
jgi:DNA modification methylase